MSTTFSSELLARVQSAEHVGVFTGAGMSAESGVPTFRGNEGIWKQFKPEELANFDAFMRNPALVWEWYNHRKQLCAGIVPNPGHYALAAMESRHRHFSIATQNIDNLHRRAGSINIHELHGNIERSFCTGCGKYYSVGPTFLSVNTEDQIPLLGDVPRCTTCRGLVRPDVVWFGEMLPADEWEAAVRAAERADVYFSIGTSSVVYPAASLPMMAKSAGAYVVEMNIERTEFSHKANEVVIGKSGELLPLLLEQYSLETDGPASQPPSTS